MPCSISTIIIVSYYLPSLLLLVFSYLLLLRCRHIKKHLGEVTGQDQEIKDVQNGDNSKGIVETKL